FDKLGCTTTISDILSFSDHLFNSILPKLPHPINSIFIVLYATTLYKMYISI
ncbi:branched-chain amino acid transport system II carrier protein, partial [Ehrlichia ruminantium]